MNQSIPMHLDPKYSFKNTTNVQQILPSSNNTTRSVHLCSMLFLLAFSNASKSRDIRESLSGFIFLEIKDRCLSWACLLTCQIWNDCLSEKYTDGKVITGNTVDTVNSVAHIQIDIKTEYTLFGQHFLWYWKKISNHHVVTLRHMIPLDEYNISKIKTFFIIA